MRLFDNLLYKIAAVVVACVLWASAQGFRDVKESLDLPIVFEELSDELVVVDQSAHEVNFQIKGSRAALGRVKKNLVRYPISLEDVKPGENHIPITNERIESGLARGAQISGRSPSNVVLRIEPVVKKRVRVRANVDGELPAGLKIKGVSVDPPEVNLAGAKTQMRRLDQVTTERLDVSKLRETTTLEPALILGYSHVWRADEDAEPVKVQIEIESELPPEEPERAEAPRSTG